MISKLLVQTLKFDSSSLVFGVETLSNRDNDAFTLSKVFCNKLESDVLIFTQFG